jgi:truncated hemoglobin YjbI
MTPTSPASPQPPPTVFAWAGGAEAFSRLTRIFYGHVKTDPILAPVFATMSPEHPEWVAQWLGEVFGGPATYTQERGGYAPMMARHLGRALTEQQRARWVQLMGEAADEAGLPADPEFRSAFVSYLEWGSRLAGQQPAWGRTAAAHAGAPLGLGHGRPAGRHSELGPTAVRSCGSTRRRAATRSGGDRLAELRPPHPAAVHRPRPGLDGWAFDLGDLAAVREHADAILDQLASGRMPCYAAWPAERVALFRRWMESGKLD